MVEVSLRYFFGDTSAQVVGEANAPWCARCDLFTSDDAVVEPTMNGGRRNAECIGNLCDIHQFSIWWVGWPLITSDVPLSAQTTDKIRSEAMTIRGSALLSVENTGYDGVRVVGCLTTEQRNGVFIGAHGCAS